MEPSRGRNKGLAPSVFSCAKSAVRRLLVLLAHGGLEAQLRLGPRSPCPNNSRAPFFPRPRDMAYPI